MYAIVKTPSGNLVPAKLIPSNNSGKVELFGTEELFYLAPDAPINCENVIHGTIILLIDSIESGKAEPSDSKMPTSTIYLYPQHGTVITTRDPAISGSPEPGDWTHEILVP